MLMVLFLVVALSSKMYLYDTGAGPQKTAIFITSLMVMDAAHHYNVQRALDFSLV